MEKGLSLWSDYIWNWVFRSGSPTERERQCWAGPAPAKSRLTLQCPHPGLPAYGQPAPPGSLTPDPSSPTRPCLLTTSRPPRWPDFTHHFCPNFRFDRGSNGASRLLTGLWPCRPRSWVLILAWPLIYHSLKLSYLLPYLLSASSLWNASLVRTGTSPLLYPWLPEQSPAQNRCSGNVC